MQKAKIFTNAALAGRCGPCLRHSHRFAASLDILAVQRRPSATRVQKNPNTLQHCKLKKRKKRKNKEEEEEEDKEEEEEEEEEEEDEEEEKQGKQ